MDVTAEKAFCLHDDGFIQLGWELSDSDLHYVLIHLPETDDPPEEAFFGHNHYVEVLDQLYGEYGGLAKLEVLNDHQVLRLDYEVPDLDGDLVVTSTAPISPEAMSQLRRAEALVTVGQERGQSL